MSDSASDSVRDTTPVNPAPLDAGDLPTSVIGEPAARDQRTTPGVRHSATGSSRKTPVRVFSRRRGIGYRRWLTVWPRSPVYGAATPLMETDKEVRDKTKRDARHLS